MSKKISLDSSVTKYDYHHVIMHYVYLKNPGCQHRIDNYIALYGFLRTICLIFVLLTDWLFFNALYQFPESSWVNNCIIIIFTSVSCIVYLAYLKFYKRFYEENLFTLVTSYGKGYEMR